MNYKEAQELSLKKRWKTTTCSQGEECWCRIIEPEEPISYGEYEEEFYIAGSGDIGKEFAEHIVKIHNEWTNKNN